MSKFEPNKCGEAEKKERPLKKRCGAIGAININPQVDEILQQK